VEGLAIAIAEMRTERCRGRVGVDMKTVIATGGRQPFIRLHGTKQADTATAAFAVADTDEAFRAGAAGKLTDSPGEAARPCPCRARRSA